MATVRSTLFTLYTLKADLLKAFTHVNSNLDKHIRRLEEVVLYNDGWAQVGNTGNFPNRAPVTAHKTQTPHPVAIQNRFSVLDYETDFPRLPDPHNPSLPSTNTCTNQRKQARKRVKTKTRKASHPSPLENKAIPTEPKKQVLILADSHGRHLSSILSRKLPPNYSVSSIFKPNGRFADVTAELDTHTKTMTNQDTVFIIGGQNDINLGGNFTPEQHVNKLQCAAQNTNIVVSTLPFWYNRPTLCSEIKHANQQLKLQLRETDVTLFEMNFLSVKHFTRHGLHMNLAGKHAVGEKLAQYIINSSPTQPPAKNPSLSPSLRSPPPTLILNPLTPSCEPTPVSSIPTTNDASISSQPVTAGTHYNLRPRTRGKNGVNI